MKNIKNIITTSDHLPGFEKHIWKKFFITQIKPLLNESHRLYFDEKDPIKHQKREKYILKLMECTLLIMQLYQSESPNSEIILKKLAEHDLQLKIKQKKITLTQTKTNQEMLIFSEIIRELFSPLKPEEHDEFV